MELTDYKTGKNGKKPRKTQLDLSTMVYGKVPPQARELEQDILGNIMLMKGSFDAVVEVIKQPEVFYVDAHQRIFSCMVSLSNKSQPIDVRTVVEELRSTEQLDLVGGPYYLTKIMGEVAGGSVAHYAKIVFQKFIQRELIRISGEVLSDAYEDSTDAFELLDQAEGKLFKVSNHLQARQEVHVSTLMVNGMQEIGNRVEENKKGDNYLSGVPTGFSNFNRLTHGWQPTDLIILAARPSVGKTAFALQLARNAAMDSIKPTPTAFFSLEMSGKQLNERLISAETGIDLSRIKKGRLEEADLETIYVKAVQKLAECPLWIDDSPALNIFELRAKCRRLKSQHGLGLVIIDYLQLMSGPNDNRGNREQEISQISRSLKALAKELNIPIIALSQLSRETEKRADFKPKLSDLRESGAIEQDADSVCFIYRPEYHGINHSATGESNVGETFFKFAKHRNGTTDELKLKAELWIQKFVEYPEEVKSPINKGNGLNGAKMVSQLDELNGNLPF